MASPPTQRGNLPGDLTSFVGRRRELLEVRRLVGQVQLATLTGFGGVGKTRLALRAAASSVRAFRDGVWLVDLSPLRDPGLVPEAVAAAVGVRDGGSQRGLIEVLRRKQMLVVLDNCEHLADACPALAEELLRNAPDVKILATSRQALGVPGERVFAVAPLPTPEPARLSASALATNDAVALLVERAQAMDPTFAVTDDNAEAIATLVRRLDGIPLALELAAARLRMLTPEQILRRFDDRYRLLSTASPTVSRRQQSLQAMIDWSFELCAPAERRLWARLSVFPGDFDIDAAEAICADDELPAEQVLHTLSGLVDKSVVGTARHGTVVRYRLLETLRASRAVGRAAVGAAASRSLPLPGGTGLGGMVRPCTDRPDAVAAAGVREPAGRAGILSQSAGRGGCRAGNGPRAELVLDRHRVRR